MGGYGSGRWHGHDKAHTVSGYTSLRAAWIPRDGEQRKTVTAGIDLVRQGSRVEVTYKGNKFIRDLVREMLHKPPTSEPPSQLWKGWLSVTETPIGDGARRHYRAWFVCPRCHCRAFYLYFRGGLFACRTCCKLSYESCQRSHDLDRGSAYLGLLKRGFLFEDLWKKHEALLDELDRHRSGSRESARVMARIERLGAKMARQTAWRNLLD